MLVPPKNAKWRVRAGRDADTVNDWTSSEDIDASRKLHMSKNQTEQENHAYENTHEEEFEHQKLN